MAFAGPACVVVLVVAVEEVVASVLTASHSPILLLTLRSNPSLFGDISSPGVRLIGVLLNISNSLYLPRIKEVMSGKITQVVAVVKVVKDNLRLRSGVTAKIKHSTQI